MSRRNLLVNGLRQPEPSLFTILRDSSPKCVHDSEHIHRFSIAFLCQTPQPISRFHVPTHGLWCVRPTELCVKAAETILSKCIPLLG
jgi:hypothetical protein